MAGHGDRVLCQRGVEEMRVEKRSSALSGAEWYETDEETPRVFRRIVGGVSWPHGERPGFVVVLGEDLTRDIEFDIRHVRILAEYREYLGLTFMEPQPILSCMADLRKDLCVRPFYGRVGPWQKVISDYNRDAAKQRLPTVSLHAPPGSLDFEYHAGLLRRRVLNQKTLHFGPSVLPQRLALLPADVRGLTHDNHPEIGALFYALAGMDMRSGDALPKSGRHTGPVDRAGGY